MSNLDGRNNYSGKSDAQLITIALDRSADLLGRQAASELLGRYRERVYRWCLSRVRDPEQALDLAQDILLSAYRKLHTFDNRSQFSTWLFSITRNCCLNAMRRPTLLGNEDELYALPDPHRTPDVELEQREDEERMLQLICDHLPQLDRQVLWLRCFEKVPVDEITSMLDIRAASGARAILQRARRRLRLAISQEAQKGGNSDA